MKKIYLLLLSVSLLFCMTGCAKKEVSESIYSPQDGITVEHTATEEKARIEITDTYTKDGVKYFVFKTDVSYGQEFTLSESEYDKYIGSGNDAVECTVYELKIQSNISDKVEKEKTENVATDAGSNDSSVIVSPENHQGYSFGVAKNVNIDDISVKDFIYAIDYSVDISPDNGEAKISGELVFQRYSFMGESDFTEDEIKQRVDIADNVNKEMVN